MKLDRKDEEYDDEELLNPDPTHVDMQPFENIAVRDVIPTGRCSTVDLNDQGTVKQTLVERMKGSRLYAQDVKNHKVSAHSPCSDAVYLSIRNVVPYHPSHNHVRECIREERSDLSSLISTT